MDNKNYTPPANFIDLLIDAVFAVDADANVVFASAACERILGYTPQELIGKNMFDLMAPEVREHTRESVKKVMAGEPQLHFENRYIRKDGQIVDIMWSARWSREQQVRIGVARDITERKRAELRQAAIYAISEAAYAAEDLPELCKRIHEIVGTLLQADNFSVSLYNRDTDQLSFPYYVDQYELTSKPSKPAAGTLYAEVIRTGQPLLLAPNDVARYLDEMQVSLEMTPLCWLGVPLKSPEGTMGVLEVKTYPGGVSYTEKDQELLQFVSTQIATVITRLQLQVELMHMAQYDQLTILPNRRLLHNRLEATLSAARRQQTRFAVLYIDLDKFKLVNDTLGHGVGDQLLQEVANRLKDCVRTSDTVGRVGGDEFVVLLQHVSLLEQAQTVADKIRHALCLPYTINGQSLSITPSIGIALYPEHGNDEQQLLHYADQAMYSTKPGRNTKSIVGG